MIEYMYMWHHGYPTQDMTMARARNQTYKMCVCVSMCVYVYVCVWLCVSVCVLSVCVLSEVKI